MSRRRSGVARRGDQICRPDRAHERPSVPDGARLWMSYNSRQRYPAPRPQVKTGPGRHQREVPRPARDGPLSASPHRIARRRGRLRRAPVTPPPRPLAAEDLARTTLSRTETRETRRGNRTTARYAVMTESSRSADCAASIGAEQRPAADDGLVGFTIGVTADRRRDELAALLRQHGARVVLAPALRIVPLADDTELRAATRACLGRPPDMLMANTGIGMRGWLEAAEGWGLAEPLRGALAGAYVVARGPKARGAIRAGRAARPVVAGLGELRRGGRPPAPARGGRAGGSPCSCTASGSPSAPTALEAAGADGDRGAGLPLGAAHRPGAAAPAGRPGRRPARRRRHVHLARRRSSALLRAAGTAPTAVLDALRRDVLAACVGAGHRRAAAPARRAGRGARAGPGWARWSGRSSRSCRARTVTLKVGRAPAHPARARRGDRRRTAPPGPGPDGGAAGAGPVARAGALPHRAAARPAAAAPTSTPWRWRWPGCAPACGAPRVVQTVVKRGYRLRVD